MMADRWSSPKQDGLQEQHVFSEVKRKLCGLNMFLSQGERSVAQKPLAAISSVAARL
jgi:hypothetical protein